MWSFFKKIFHQISGGDSDNDHSSLFPEDVDKLRDEFSATEEIDGPGDGISAREAFELAEEIIQSFDPEAKLRSIKSEGALTQVGHAEGWIFDFLLPTRWGTSTFTFNNRKGAESVHVRLIPFAPAGSALDNMLLDGQAGFVEQQWKVELERQASLSHSFQDSGEVLARWVSEGKTIDFQTGVVMRAITPPLGKARWELLDSPSSKKSLYNLPIE